MRSIGNKGEDQACKYLINNGYTIKKQNYYTRFGELDIITQKRTQLHIIEVKYTSQFYIDTIFKLNRKKNSTYDSVLTALFGSFQCFWGLCAI